MALKPSGITSLNAPTRTFLDTLRGLKTTSAGQIIQPTPDMNVVRQRQAEYANYLGQTDYAKQLEESQNMGKLQLALALAQRGFAAAGAPPQRGESSVSTLSRKLLSPLAGDAGAVAGRMMQQKQAINAAKSAEERQLKLAAMQKVEAENNRERDLALQLVKLMPKTATTPKGMETADFKGTLAGYLSGLGGQMDQLTLGKFGIKFVPSNYDPEKGLDPSQKNYPLARADGKKLDPAEKKKLSSLITSGYFNALKALKGGANLLDINKAFSEKFFDQNVKQLGLSSAPAGTAPNPLAAKTEAAVTAFYTNAPTLFQRQGDVGEVLKGVPFPVGLSNFRSGIGKLKLAYAAGVPFGPETNSPPPTAKGEDVTIRAENVKEMPRDSIQLRAFSEQLAKGVSYAGKLSQSATPRLDDQLLVVSKGLNEKLAALETRKNDPASIQAAKLFSGALDAVDRLDRMSVAAELSGVQGIVKGPLLAAGIKYLNTDFAAWFKTTKEQGATRDFVAGLPVLRQLFGRELVKAAEGTSARISNQDLKGVQGALASLSEDKDYSRDKVRVLRRYLVSTIKNSATQLGNFVVPDATLEKAARLGVDLKAVQGKGGYYNPYLNNGKYVVSKGQIPELSKEYQDSLRTEGLLGYISDGQQDPRFKMIKTKPDKNGTPQIVYKKDANGKDTKQVAYSSLTKANLTDPAFSGMVNFNKNWLRKTYSLGN